MMKHEFEKIAGYEVSDLDYYNIIEPMYMAVELSKEDFVKLLDKKRFALPTKKQMQNQMKKIAEHLRETCEHYTDYKAQLELEKLAREYARRFHHIDVNTNTEAYVILHKEYSHPEIQRGCTYPKTLIIGVRYTDFERLELVK